MYSYNNEECIISQQIERELQQDPGLNQICKQIGQQHQNPRLSTFLQELFKILFNTYIPPENTNKAINILNAILNKQKMRNNNQVQMKDIQLYIERKYVDAIANFYEKGFLKGYDFGLISAQYAYYKKMFIDYFQSNSNQSQQTLSSFLTKLDQAYSTQNINSLDEFELQFYESLDSNEQNCLMAIVEKDQNRSSQPSNPILEKILNTEELREQYNKSQPKNLWIFRDYLKKEKNKLADKIQGFIFYDRLKTYLTQHYFTSQVEKVKNNRNELQTQMQTLEKEVYDRDYYQIIEINNFKYFYKSLKLKKLKQMQRANLRIGAKLIDFIKQEINQVEVQRQLKTFKKWREIYNQLYQDLIDQKEPQQVLQMILNLQQLMINFLRFRWNYLFLFVVIIVENNFSENVLDQILDQVFEMIYQTTKDKLALPFDEILKTIRQKSQQNIEWYSEKIGPQILYGSSYYLENQLKYLHNKLLQITKGQQQQWFNLTEICQLEINLFNEFNNTLKLDKNKLNKFFDSILQGDKEEKDSKASFFKTYLLTFKEKLFQISYEKQEKQFNVQYYYQNVQKLKEDFKNNKLGIFQDIFERENKINQICEQFLTREIQKFVQNYGNQPNFENIKQFFTNFSDHFIKDNPFIVFMPSILKNLTFSKLKITYFEKIERVKYLAVAFVKRSEADIQKFLDCIQTQNQKDNFPLEVQYKITQDIYNFYIIQPQSNPQENREQLKLWLEPYYQPKQLAEYNSPQFNTNCVLINRLYSDQKLQIKYDEQNTIIAVKNLSSIVQDKNLLENYTQNSETNKHLQQYAQIYNELKTYKNSLIKETQTINDQNFTNKCLELLGKYSQRNLIINEMIDYKQKNKIPFLEQELFIWVKQQWQKIGQEEIQNEKNKDKKPKIQEYFKHLFSSQNNQIFIDRLQKDQNIHSEQIIRDLLKKHYQIFRQEYEKYSFRQPQQQVQQNKFNLIQIPILNKKLLNLKTDPKNKDIVTDDLQVQNFIQEQFTFFMKNLLGKIFQAVITQKAGYEFKVYQNKPINQNDSQIDIDKYKKQLQLQSKYGPQRNSYLDITLLTQNEPKNQLYYELCDYTPIQRQADFRKFMIEIEPHQEEKFKNKIRKNKWREEHPELEEILKKKVKRQAELWNQVQDFLCKRENYRYTGDSDEESEKNKNQNLQQAELIEDEQKDRIQESLKAFEKQQQTQKANTRTRLTNIETDNNLLVSKDITVKTVQYVLEQDPYFKKSKVLYKSYIL